MTNETHSVQFYWSFRSPYSYLAAERTGLDRTTFGRKWRKRKDQDP